MFLRGAFLFVVAVSAVAQTPSITVRPLSRAAVVGESVTFTVTAAGAATLSYQWRRNGTPISGATGSTLALPAVALTDRGWYQVAVTNAAGSATSVLHLSVAPPNSTVSAWGSVSGVPAGLADIAAVAAGVSSSFALKTDGSVVGWHGGESGLPSLLSNVVAIAAGTTHRLALRSDGTVLEWGANQSFRTPMPDALQDVVAIAAGAGGQSLALRADGTVAAWGTGDFGLASTPPGLNSVVHIAAGPAHNLAVKADGTVVAWGRDDSGQLAVPAGLSGVKSAAAGGDFSLALKSDGTVVGWGAILSGQTAALAGLSGVQAVQAGDDFALALKSDGTIVRWGQNGAGQLDVPAGLGPVAALAAMGAHALAMVPARAPVFLAHPAPASRSAISGEAVAYAIELDGSAPFAIQWLKDGVPLTGETAATFSIAAVLPSDSGTYSVAVGNVGGSATSAGAALSVTGPPAAPILRSQSGPPAFLGSTPRLLSVRAAGSVPLSYQWYEGAAGDVSAPVAGATGADFPAPLDRAQRYWVRVTNPVGTRDSAALRVLPWEAREPGWGPNDLAGASYANGRYYVMGMAGARVSTDGIAWQPVPGSFFSSALPGKVAYANGVYISVVAQT